MSDDHQFKRKLSRALPLAEQSLKSRYKDEDLRKMIDQANRERDGALLRTVHELTRNGIDGNREVAERMVGKAMMAGLELSKAQLQARETGDSPNDPEITKAIDYYNARWEIARDYCKAAGVSSDKIAPALSSEQIQEIKEHLPRMEDDYNKREIEEALPRAEQSLKERTEAEFERERMRPHERPVDQQEQDRDRFEPTRDRDSGFRSR